MPGIPPALLSVVAFAVPVAVAWLVLHLGWRPWMKRYPARTPSADAVRRSFQSFGIAVINNGWSIHVAADERYLHLTPMRLLRWLGAGPISVPWTSITVVKHNRAGTRATAKFDGRTVLGPAWCLDLAAPGQESASQDTSASGTS